MKEKKKKLYLGLRVEMVKNGDTQQSLSNEMGLTLTTFSHKITGRSQWNISEIDYLCNKYKKDYYELFRGE